MREYRMTNEEFQEILKINREQYPVLYGSGGVLHLPLQNKKPSIRFGNEWGKNIILIGSQ
ncbi:MAG: hypothetical protein ACRC0A_07045 [Chitinophagaceae bacterium]